MPSILIPNQEENSEYTLVLVSKGNDSFKRCMWDTVWKAEKKNLNVLVFGIQVIWAWFKTKLRSNYHTVCLRCSFMSLLTNFLYKIFFPCREKDEERKSKCLQSLCAERCDKEQANLISLLKSLKSLSNLSH